MLENQENMKNKSLRAQILKNNKDLSNESITTQWGVLYLVKKALPYLEMSDNPTRLFGVCKEWNRKLLKPVCEFYLIQNHHVVNDDIRLNIWKRLLRIVRREEALVVTLGYLNRIRSKSTIKKCLRRSIRIG